MVIGKISYKVPIKLTLTTYQNIKYNTLSYVIVGNELFKNMLEGILFKCLSEGETYLAVFSAHSGSC